MADEADLLFGVVMTFIGAALLALSMNVQRYSLAYPEPKVPLLGCKLPQFWAWFVGLLIYWAANGLYAVSLNYAPLSLLGGVFSTLLVFNLFFGWYLLDEKLTRAKIMGAVVIMCGVGFTIGATPGHIPTEFDPSDVNIFITNPVGALYLIILVGIVVSCVVIICIYERRYPVEEKIELVEPVDPTSPQKIDSAKIGVEHAASARPTNNNKRKSSQAGIGRSVTLAFKHQNTQFIANAVKRTFTVYHTEIAPPHPDAPHWLDSVMSIIYPGSLGIDEGITHLTMKAWISLLTHCSNTSSCGEPIIWSAVSLWIVTSVATLWWLVIVFKRYEVTQALPVEYGAVGAVNACSGLIFYQEHKYMEDWRVAMILTGVLFIILGIWVGRCDCEPKKIKLENTPNSSKTAADSLATLTISQLSVVEEETTPSEVFVIAKPPAESSGLVTSDQNYGTTGERKDDNVKL